MAIERIIAVRVAGSNTRGVHIRASINHKILQTSAIH